MIRQSSPASRPNRLANRKASPFSKQSVAHAFRVMAPTLVALTFASVAHAQGTMDFSGAQTLIGHRGHPAASGRGCRTAIPADAGGRNADLETRQDHASERP